VLDTTEADFVVEEEVGLVKFLGIHFHSIKLLSLGMSDQVNREFGLADSFQDNKFIKVDMILFLLTRIIVLSFHDGIG